MVQKDLQLLLSRPEKPNPSVLSVYLNVDQSRQANLNRGFERQLKDMMASLRTAIRDARETERFRSAAHHLEDFVSAYQVRARGLVMFFDEADGFFWHQELQIPVQDLARWDRECFLQPIAAAIDEFEGYGVLLADRANSRLFVVSLGEIEEVSREGSGPKEVRHIKTVGMDRLGSASQVQRKADEQVRRNLRRAVRELDRLAESKHIDHLVLAGATDVTSELRNLLPKRLALRVINTLELEMDAPPQEVLAATLTLTEKYERNTEEEIVKEVVTSAAKAARAVVGLSRTLKHINQDRVWQLVCSEDFHSPGFECSKCTSLFSVEQPSCLYCGAALIPVTDVVERAVEHALRKGARIELVKSEAAASLDTAGGIGAFLKARTGSIQA